MTWQICKRVLPVFLILVTASTGTQTGSAVERFQSLQDELRHARSAKDWRANVATAQELEDFLNESPDSLLEASRALVHAGDLSGALRKLDWFVAMGQASDLLEKSDEFSPLRQQAKFADIEKGMQTNRTAVSRASTAFRLPDSALLAEDVDYDPQSKRFLITSIREKKIVSSDMAGTSRDFAKAPDDWPILAIKADPPRGVVWATEVAMQGLSFAPASDWGSSAVLCYDLKSGKLLRRIVAPHGTALGDMALTRNGDLIISDGEGGGVYRLRAKSKVLERIDNGDFISPQTPAMTPDGEHVFVPDYVRGIGVLDLATKSVRWLSMEGRYALNGIDGLYFNRGVLIAVQNGTFPERVTAFALDATLAKVISETIIERSTDTLGDPTHGVIIGNEFYYIANSGWDVIDDHGNVKQGAKLSEPRIMRVPLALFSK
jgi:hypothetical protein